MELQVVTPQTYTFRPTFEPSQRLISRRNGQKEVSYVPISQLPEQVLILLKVESIEFTFSYNLSEKAEEKVLGCGVQVEVGINTRRIFRLSADFAKGDFDALINRFADIDRCFKQLKEAAPREAVKKSYDIIMKLTDHAKEIILTDKAHIHKGLLLVSASI